MNLEAYVGRPHSAEWDCYACVRQVLAAEAGITIPALPEQIDRSQWVKVTTPATFDLAEMMGLTSANGKTRIAPVHVGLYIAPDRVLHCEASTGTVCVPIDRLRLPIVAFWRFDPGHR